jgi:glutamate 5-kinase
VNSIIQNSRRLVIKIGSSLALTDDGKNLDPVKIARFAMQIAELRKLDKEVVLVASGATIVGMQMLGMTERPEESHDWQACGAIGQMALTHAYGDVFRGRGLHAAQVLLTLHEVDDPDQRARACDMLLKLLQFGAIPIINQNDALTTLDNKLGDNDRAAAVVANMIDADLLIILTDQKGLFSADPRKDPNAQLVHEGKAGDPKLEAMALFGGSAGHGQFGLGGMYTKVLAAKHAGQFGVHTLIAWGYEENILVRLIQGEAIGTRLMAQPTQAKRSGWFASIRHSIAARFGMHGNAG